MLNDTRICGKLVYCIFAFNSLYFSGFICLYVFVFSGKKLGIFCESVWFRIVTNLTHLCGSDCILRRQCVPVLISPFTLCPIIDNISESHSLHINVHSISNYCSFLQSTYLSYGVLITVVVIEVYIEDR